MDITTRRLHLLETYRPVDEHIEWLNNKELMRFSEQQFIEHDFDTQRHFLMEALIAGTPLVYDIRLKLEPPVGGGLVHEGEVIGLGRTIGSLHIHIDKQHARGDLGIMIGPEYGNNGYGREAWNAASDYCLYKLQLRKIEAGCVKENLAMIRILWRDGWETEGARVAHFFYDDRVHDLVLFGKHSLSVWKGAE